MDETPINFGSDGTPQMMAGPGNLALITAQNIRREHTGLHADIAIFLMESPPRLIARDVFNVGRHEDVVRLCRACHRRLPRMAQESYPLENLENDLLYFLLWVSREWEGQQFSIMDYEDQQAPPPQTFILFPYILDGGGTILFGPRETGKSYICIQFAAAIANGLNSLWTTTKRPVLYVNLERDPASMRRRDYYVARAFGVPRTNIKWLHARGYGMEAVARQVKRIANPDTVVFYDSISRMGIGGLNDDQTANRSSDLANWASRTWVAIGHTPRGDNSHLTGSMHFENAADILVRLTKDEAGGAVGLSLQVVKANDFSKPEAEIISLTFGEEGLAKIESSSSKSFPGLIGTGDDTTKKRIARINECLDLIGSGSAEDVHTATGIARQHISSIFRNTPTLYRVTHKQGNTIFWCRRDGKEVS